MFTELKQVSVGEKFCWSPEVVKEETVEKAIGQTIRVFAYQVTELDFITKATGTLRKCKVEQWPD